MRLLLLLLAYAIVLFTALSRAGYRARGPVAPPPTTSRPRPRRILIIGATGGTGRQLLAQALERGYAVTALVRRPDRLGVEHPQLTVLKGDVLDYASIEAAMPGVEAVVSALGHTQFFRPTRILSQGTANLLRAMEAHGVSRFVCETSLGIGDGAGRLGLYNNLLIIPLVLPFYFWDKARQERVIAGSNADWTIVRPGILTHGEKRGSYRHGRRVGNFLWTPRISRADVADFMLNQLETDAYLRAAPGVAR